MVRTDQASIQERGACRVLTDFVRRNSAGSPIQSRSADTAWRIAAAADVNGDGHADLIWRNTTTGSNVVWYLSGPSASILSQAALQPVPDLAWQIAVAADVNGDGHPDLIWRNSSTGADVVWFLSGTTLLSQASLQSVPDTSWVLRP